MSNVFETPEYCAWRNMIQRCENLNDPGYKNYGSRGIKVCDRWHDFHNFFADMGKKPEGLTLEREDNDGDYKPGNCKWATYKEQNNNRRKAKSRSCGPTRQRWFQYEKDDAPQGISNNQSEIARKFGLCRPNISDCLHGKQKTAKGWSFEWL